MYTGLVSDAFRLVIVGGVAGGMSAAARARRLDEHAEIVVLERGPEVSFANCGLPYFVSGEIDDEAKLLLHTPGSLKASLNLDVRVRHEVLAIDSDAKRVRVRDLDAGTEFELGYDALVLSPGAEAIRPDIPGIDSPRLRNLRTVEDAATIRSWVDAGAKRAVVLGAGFIGLEAAEALHLAGLEVTLVQRGPHVLSPLEAEMAYFVERELKRLGINLKTEARATAIEPGPDHDVVALSDGSRIAADVIALATGVQPRTQLAEAAGIAITNGAIHVDEHGRTSVPGIWAVGDAVQSHDAITGEEGPVALAGPANRAGRLVADDIFRPGQARPIPPTVGTAIVRIGELAAGLTGANAAELRRAGRSFTTLHAHPNQHAGYFPGAVPVRLVLHFDPVSGEILGAQAVGSDGVDKRLDVLATAIRAGLTAPELIDLDLSYAPPFGAAKDPINLLGYAAENVLNGTLTLWHASELDAERASSLLLDVRRDDEVAKLRHPDALHVPHTQLRARLAEVRSAAAGRPVRVFCASGVRSAIAHRILSSHGFDSASLSGGIQTLQASGAPLIEGSGS